MDLTARPLGRPTRSVLSTTVARQCVGRHGEATLLAAGKRGMDGGGRMGNARVGGDEGH